MLHQCRATDWTGDKTELYSCSLQREDDTSAFVVQLTNIGEQCGGATVHQAHTKSESNETNEHNTKLRLWSKGVKDAAIAEARW